MAQVVAVLAVVEALCEPLGERADIRSQYRHEAAGEEDLSDLCEVCVVRARGGGPRMRHFLPENPSVELLQLRARLEPELGDELAPGFLVRTKRVRLPPGVVEREHELTA